jgi:opacity protein-like surface antigen
MRLLPWATILVLLLLGTPSTVHADDLTASPFEVGATAAYSRVTFFRGSGFQGAGKLRSRNSFATGLFSHYRLHVTERMHLGIQPELLFVRRGAKGEYEGVILGSWQLNYIELPVLGRVLFPLSGPVSPYIVAGPRLGLLVSAETTDANGNVQDSSDETNTFDVGFSAGVGALIQVGSRVMLTIEGRYDQSLMNRLDFDGEEVTNDQRHRAFFLMLGVSMGIGSPTRTSAP